MVINEIKIKTDKKSKAPIKVKLPVKIKKPTTRNAAAKIVALETRKSLANVAIDKEATKITNYVNNGALAGQMINLQPSVKETPIKNNSSIRKAVLDELHQTEKIILEKKTTGKKIEAKKKKTIAIPAVKTAKQITQEIVPEKPAIKLKCNICKKIITGIIIIVLIIFSLMVNIYFYPLNNFSKAMASIMPIPALTINKTVINLNDFQEDFLALKKYLSRQDVPFTEASLKNRVKKSLIEKTILNNLASQQNINISDDEINNQINALLADKQDISSISNLVKELYGWNLPLYQKKVLKPLLQAQELNQAFNAANNKPEIKDALNNFLAKIKEDPKQFDVIATAVNEDSSRYTNGDLGWMIPGETAPEFESAVQQLKKGEVSDIVETAYGYHLIKLIEKNEIPTGQQTFHLKHIFLKKNQFNDYLSDEIKKAKVISLIKI